MRGARCPDNVSVCGAEQGADTAAEGANDDAAPTEEEAADAAGAAEQAAEEVAGAEEAVEAADSEQLDVDSMTVADLKAELAKRGLDTAGRKADLAARLTASLEVSGTTLSQHRSLLCIKKESI